MGQLNIKKEIYFGLLQQKKRKIFKKKENPIYLKNN